MHAEFAKEYRHVNFNRADRELKSERDLLVGHALNDQVQYLSLPAAQHVQRRLRCRKPRLDPARRQQRNRAGRDRMRHGPFNRGQAFCPVFIGAHRQ